MSQPQRTLSPSAQRMHMALGQLMTNQVLDARILEALTSVPRERFVPPHLASSAYVDEDLPLGESRFLIAPLPFAQMLKLATITPEDKVLVVGCGTAYSVAVISRLVQEVIGIDTVDSFISTAQAQLAVLGITNARAIKVGDLAKGFPQKAPYDVILLEGSVEAVPSTLMRMLTPGDRLIAAERVERNAALVQGLSKLVEYVNRDGDVFRRETIEVSLPPLPGFDNPTAFLF